MTNFKLFPYCMPVKGYSRSIICNLHRQNFIFIPNSLFDLLIEIENNSFEDIKEKYSNNDYEVIEKNLTFLVDKEFAFRVQNSISSNFTPLKLDWKSPSIITNAIIDINNNSDFDFQNIFNQLDELHCKSLQLRFYDFLNIDILAKILSLLDGLSILSTELLLPYNEAFLTDKLTPFLKNDNSVTTVYFFSSPKFEIVKYNSTDLIFTTNIISSEQDCGNISPAFFSVNLKCFTESQKFNSCLNRKVSINTKGEIKNCPAMDFSFGNIKLHKLKDVVNSKPFRKNWNINKDKIDICKDCEFRFICTDCRAIREDKSNFYSKPAKCTYNPYTNEGF